MGVSRDSYRERVAYRTVQLNQNRRRGTAWGVKQKGFEKTPSAESSSRVTGRFIFSSALFIWMLNAERILGRDTSPVFNPIEIESRAMQPLVSSPENE